MELGALFLRIQEEGLENVLAALRKTEEGAKLATQLERALNKEISETNRLFGLQARLADAGSKTQVAAIRRQSQSQAQYLQQLGATDVQLLQHAGSVQQFEKRVAAAEKAQARQVQTTRVFGQELTNAQGKVVGFGRASITTLNATAFAFSQLAADGEVSLRSITQSAAGALAFLGPKGAIASLVITGVAATAEAVGATMRSDREARKLDLQASAKAELTIAKARLDAEAAVTKAALDQGKITLQRNFAERQRIIDAGTNAEVAARQKAIEAAQIRLRILDPLIGRDKEKDEARREVQQLNAEITAIEAKRRGDTAALTAERVAAERALAKQILDFENRRLEAQGKTHDARMQQIQSEADAFRRLPLQAGETREGREASAAAFQSALESQAKVERQLTLFETQQLELETERVLIQRQLLNGTLSQEEATAKVAKVEKERRQALRDSLAAALTLAITLDDPKLEAQIRAMAAAVEQLGFSAVDITTDPITKRMQQSIEKIQRQVAAGLLSEERGRQLVREAGLGAGLASGIADAMAAGFGAGIAGDSIAQALGNQISSVMGQVLVQTAANWIKASILMQQIQAFFVANPLAAIGAAGALLAFGRLLGGRGGGGGGGIGFGTSSTNTPISIRRLIVDPNAGGLGRQLAPLPTSSLAAMPVGPSYNVIGVHTPLGKKLIGTANSGYVGKGGR